MDQLLLTAWLPIILMVVVAFVFVAVNFFLSDLLGVDRPAFHKLSPYESGNEPEGVAHQPVSVHYSLVAVLFILFDIEIIFLYPWAMSIHLPGITWPSIAAVSVFVTILAAGYFYAWREGVFEWM